MLSPTLAVAGFIGVHVAGKPSQCCGGKSSSKSKEITRLNTSDPRSAGMVIYNDVVYVTGHVPGVCDHPSGMP